MPWVLGHDLSHSEVKDFAVSRGCTSDSRVDMWMTIFSEVEKILRYKVDTCFCLGCRAEEMKYVVYFRASRLTDPTYNLATGVRPTKEQIMGLRRLFGRREMWYWDFNNGDHVTQKPPRPAIYGDDELDKDMVEDETIRAGMALMSVKEEGEEGEDAKESNSKAGSS